MFKINGKSVTVYDNDATADQYTIVIKNEGVYAASGNPFAPHGIGCYACDYDKFQYSRALGKKVKDFESLPIDVQSYIKQLCTDYEDEIPPLSKVKKECEDLDKADLFEVIDYCESLIANLDELNEEEI